MISTIGLFILNIALILFVLMVVLGVIGIVLGWIWAVVFPILQVAFLALIAAYSILWLGLRGVTYPLALTLGNQIRFLKTADSCLALMHPGPLWSGSAYQNKTTESETSTSTEEEQQTSSHESKGSPPKQETIAPHEILGVNQSSSIDEIKYAYRELMKKNHPDRVASLDPVFQDLAHQRAKDIQRAYEQLLATCA